MSLFIEDKLVDFAELIDDEEGAKPALLFLSSDEYSPFKLVIEHLNDESFSIIITGDGFSRFVMKVDQYEQ